MLTQKDKEIIAKKGISEEKLNNQLESFKVGFPYLKLFSTASVGKGIMIPSDAEIEQYLDAWKMYLDKNKKVQKFVPASGAASRMFKDLFEFVDSDDSAECPAFISTFFSNIESFAFYSELNDVCLKNNGKSIAELVELGDKKTVITNLLSSEGLNYGNLPKGLLKFHSYSDGNRTPLEEHLVEGALYAASTDGKVNVHFTVSPEHKDLFKKKVEETIEKYSKDYNVDYSVTFSEQKSSTDTVAATSDNEPFRTNDGKILFRPGGHGALIENLNDLDAEVVFVKNIDNVVPDKLKGDTIKYKQLIAGVLVSVQKRIFNYIKLLNTGSYTHAELEEMIHFLHDTMCCRNPHLKQLEDSELVIYLKNKLNRPVRVCGMVRNAGEPGGGPFIAYNSDGTYSLQILESSQIDKTNSEYMEMFKSGTHFNPVDLVCGICDYNGEKFDLTKYVDPMTGFISSKSKDGKELKALELPGLWNGAMSDWNTIFVEVPLSTFNPVKTVNDLLRDEHQ